MKNFKFISAFIKRSCQLLQLTRDEIVRSTFMGSNSASGVWNGKDIRLGYYLIVLKLLFARSDNPRYKLTRKQLLESLVEALLQELDDLREK